MKEILSGYDNMENYMNKSLQSSTFVSIDLYALVYADT